jgi:hypothetical protein
VEDLCEGLVTRRSNAAARRTKALETVRQTAMPVRSIGKAKPRGWPCATTLAFSGSLSSRRRTRSGLLTARMQRKDGSLP